MFTKEEQDHNHERRKRSTPPWRIIMTIYCNKQFLIFFLLFLYSCYIFIYISHTIAALRVANSTCARKYLTNSVGLSILLLSQVNYGFSMDYTYYIYTITSKI